MTGRITVSKDRPEFDDIRARIGEDPARFLAHCSDNDVTMLAAALMDGIDERHRLVAWARAEHRLGNRTLVVRELGGRFRDVFGYDGGESFDTAKERAYDAALTYDSVDELEQAIETEVQGRGRRWIVAALNQRRRELASDREQSAEVPA